LQRFKHVSTDEKYPKLPLDPMFADDFDIELGGLRIWVHGRQFPDKTDGGFDDWLWITAQYQSFGAVVWTSGPITLTSEFHGFLRDLKVMDKELRGTAAFKSLDPGLNVSLEMNTLGQISFHVDITPDHMTQKHSFDDPINQSYLPAAIHGLQRVVDQYKLTS
jgi:hypothetical protein